MSSYLLLHNHNQEHQLNKIDHLLHKNLGFEFFHQSSDCARNLDFAFGKKGDIVIELITPHDFDIPCAVTNLIKKQPCSPYHICYEINDWDETLKSLKASGYKQMGKEIISDIYGYSAKGVFMFSKGTGLIEIIERCH